MSGSFSFFCAPNWVHSRTQSPLDIKYESYNIWATPLVPLNKIINPKHEKRRHKKTHKRMSLEGTIFINSTVCGHGTCYRPHIHISTRKNDKVNSIVPHAPIVTLALRE